MRELTKRDIDISYEIKKYVLQKKKFRYSEITNDLKKYASKKTIYNNLKPFLNKKWILKNNKTKEYYINPYIKTWDKDPDLQIREGEKKELNLLRRAKEKEEKFEKFTDLALNKERELRIRIMENVQFSFNFKQKDINKDIVFRKNTEDFLNNLIFSLIREAIIMNPENWKVLEILEDFNLEFRVIYNLNNDKKIIEIINQLKKEYLKIGRIPHSLYAPFTRENIIELPSEQKSDLEEYFHKEAFYDTYLRKKEIEQHEILYEKFLDFINFLTTEYLELFTSEDFNEQLLKIRDFLKKLNDHQRYSIDIQNITNLIYSTKEFLKRIKETEFKGD